MPDLPSVTLGSTSVWLMRSDADSTSAGSLAEGIAQLNTESDRSVAIIGGTIVELTLMAALKTFLHPNEKITKELFKTTGALGAFSTKIDLGFLIGLYGHEAHRDLITMKDIRNRFAHNLSVRDFNTQQIKAWVMNLALVERHTMQTERGKAASEYPTVSTYWIGVDSRDRALANPRERYLLSAQVFCAGLDHARQARMPTPIF